MSDRSIQTAVRKLAGTFKADTVELIAGTVKSVDEAEATCEVEIQGEVVLPGVLLQNTICDGMLILPKVNSGVYVLKSKYNFPFVVQYSDVDKFYLQVEDSSLTLTNDGKIQMNDGSYGSLIQIQKLVDKINALENLLNGFINIYNSHTHIASAFGSPTSVPSALETQSISPVTSVSDIENDKITHGK